MPKHIPAPAALIEKLTGRQMVCTGKACSTKSAVRFQYMMIAVISLFSVLLIAEI